jgi:hypothetical protein
MVTKRKLTPAEQRLFDQVLVERYPACLKEINDRGLEGCARWAIDQAATLLRVRREYLGNNSGTQS